MWNATHGNVIQQLRSFIQYVEPCQKFRENPPWTEGYKLYNSETAMAKFEKNCKTSQKWQLRDFLWRCEATMWKLLPICNKIYLSHGTLLIRLQTKHSIIDIKALKTESSYWKFLNALIKNCP